MQVFEFDRSGVVGELFEIVEPVGRAPGRGEWVSGVGRSSGWWSPGWVDGSAARDFDPLDESVFDGRSDDDAPRECGRIFGGGGADDGTGDGTGGGFGTGDGFGDGAASGAGIGGRPSWVLVAGVVEAVGGLVSGGVPESAGVCLAEVEELLGARDRLTSAICARVDRVHRTGEVRAQGHASTRTWLRGVCGVDGPGASRLLMLAAQLARLEVVRERFAAGVLSEGVVAAICAVTVGLSDEQARVAERILVELAGRAGVGEVAKAGRFLRAVLDPDGADDEHQGDTDRRFLVVRPTGSGGMEGEFRLPREAAARLRTWLDAYAKPKVEGDERPLRVRNADAFIMLLEQQISTELLVLVNAESLPDDHPAKAAKTGAEAGAEAGAGGGASSGVGPDRTDVPRSRGRSDWRNGHAPEDESGQRGGSEDESAERGEPERRSEPEPAWEWGSGPGPGVSAGVGGRVDRMVPGLLFATGEWLPVREIHRLARTSSLVRLVMDAEGQVLDLGRKARLANKAQRKAVYARYATCWIDGCPLPATLCQIDHADNWVDGGMTDLLLLGPACQFHNRDRYRRPRRYQRRRQGKDRWAFTYLNPHANRPRRT
ncbi:HNH endonuclease signature motif containing protein [Planotetraspora mira]|uniref:HNH endonuclease signature motif containing protein n=1 Tax=Planotetraspora mira TaxID=58121 RepID=UPI00366DC85C